MFQNHCISLCTVNACCAGAFKFETKLEVLKLGWCKVGGGEGAKAMADLLMYNKTLRQVSWPVQQGAASERGYSGVVGVTGEVDCILHVLGRDCTAGI